MTQKAKANHPCQTAWPQRLTHANQNPSLQRGESITTVTAMVEVPARPVVKLPKTEKPIETAATAKPKPDLLAISTTTTNPIPSAGSASIGLSATCGLSKSVTLSRPALSATKSQPGTATSLPRSLSLLFPVEELRKGKGNSWIFDLKRRAATGKINVTIPILNEGKPAVLHGIAVRCLLAAAPGFR